MTDAMTDVFLLIYGIIFVVSIVALLDWLGRRKDRQSKPRLPA